MKTVKTNKKNTKKSVKKEPLFIVDLTNVQFIDELPQKFITAKVRYNIPITGDELFDVALFGANFACWCIFNDVWNNYRTEKFEVDVKTFESIIATLYNKNHKLPWYKRAWNWITRKNK